MICSILELRVQCLFRLRRCPYISSFVGLLIPSNVVWQDGVELRRLANKEMVRRQKVHDKSVGDYIVWIIRGFVDIFKSKKSCRVSVFNVDFNLEKCIFNICRECYIVFSKV